MAPANQDRWRIESQSLLWLLWCAFQMNAWARTGMKGKKPGTYTFCIFLSTFCSFLKAHKDTLKSFTIINLEKKKRQELQSHVFNPFIHKLWRTQTAVWAVLPLSPAVTWLSVRYLGCRLGAAGRFRCCNQTPLIPPRLITRLKFCTNWLASHTTARGPRPPGNPWRQMRA